jgi:hypothetical protein
MIPDNLRGTAGVAAWFLLLAIGTSWPLAANFTAALTSDGVDARHNVWQLWHVREALVGRGSLFWSDLLYYPVGASMLTHGTGPVLGLLALPFWPWGPEAAYNGGLIVDLWLTGCAMYVLARGVGLPPLASLFAGTVLAMSDMHLAGLLGHKEKTCLVFLPIALLAATRALDPRRSLWWTASTAGLLLVILFTSGWQFVLACIGSVTLAIYAWAAEGGADRSRIALRAGALGLVCVAVLAPPLAAVSRAAAGVSIDRNFESSENSADVIEFVAPGPRSLLLGAESRRIHRRNGLVPSIETAVALTWTALILSVVAWRRDRRAGAWTTLLVVCVVLALGPSLQIGAQRLFTEYRLTIPLPYAVLTSLPGLDFMRTPGRFMLLGFVALGVTAGIGFDALLRFPRRRLLAVGIFAALLIETWPRPWPQERLRPVPAFYRTIATDPALYGVFDLPLEPAPGRHVPQSSHYQMYQMTHRKGIASGYLSRTPARHPLFPCLVEDDREKFSLAVDAAPVRCEALVLAALRRNGYRYVVWHLPPGDQERWRQTWAHLEAQRFVDLVLGGIPPVSEDALARVYAVSGARVTLPPVTIELDDNWYSAEEFGRWARSPASLTVRADVHVRGRLDLVPSLVYEPHAKAPGSIGVLSVTAGGMTRRVPLRARDTASVPIELPPGTHAIALSLEAGNFRPRAFGSADPRELSFALRSIDLRTR